MPDESPKVQTHFDDAEFRIPVGGRKGRVTISGGLMARIVVGLIIAMSLGLRDGIPLIRSVFGLPPLPTAAVVVQPKDVRDALGVHDKAVAERQAQITKSQERLLDAANKQVQVLDALLERAKDIDNDVTEHRRAVE